MRLHYCTWLVSLYLYKKGSLPWLARRGLYISHLIFNPSAERPDTLLIAILPFQCLGLLLAPMFLLPYIFLHYSPPSFYISSVSTSSFFSQSTIIFPTCHTLNRASLVFSCRVPLSPVHDFYLTTSSRCFSDFLYTSLGFIILPWELDVGFIIYSSVLTEGNPYCPVCRLWGKMAILAEARVWLQSYLK